MKRIKTICHNRMLLIKSEKLVSAIPAELNCETRNGCYRLPRKKPSKYHLTKDTLIYFWY